VIVERFPGADRRSNPKEVRALPRNYPPLRNLRRVPIFDPFAALLANDRHLRKAVVADGGARRGSLEGSSIICPSNEALRAYRQQVGGRNKLVDNAALFVFASNTDGLREPA
jgi:hypothetical protein